MAYRQFRRFDLDPKNDREVLDLAITRAFQSSGGELNAFNAGSPLVTLLESLTSAHMEFLFWLNSLPEAMVLTYIAEALGANRNFGTKAQTTLQVTLNNALTGPFILRKGTEVYSNVDSNIVYALDNDLLITPGNTTGSVLASSKEIGSAYNVQAGELTGLFENFAYVQSVTNTSASTSGTDFESLEEVRDRVQTLMSQIVPVSNNDWLNVINLYFPNKAAEVKVEDGILYLYIQNYTVNTIFENYVNNHKAALQKVLIFPYVKATLQITIKSDLNFDDSQCLEIAENISNNLLTFIGRSLQPIDIYTNFANNYLQSQDLIDFQVLYYYSDLNPLTAQAINFQQYDFIGGQVLKDLSNNYFLVNSSFNVVVNPFDEAALGYLEYHPVYTTLGPGNYSAGDIVLVSGVYYLITSTGAFNPLTTTNWVILSAPITWDFQQDLNTTDFILKPGTASGIDHGFIPLFDYTTAVNFSNYISAISPVTVSSGASISPGQYWRFLGLEEVIYYNNTSSNYTADPLTVISAQAEVEIFNKPDVQYSKLSRDSKYPIGQITVDNNFIYIDSQGALSPIPTGLNISQINPAIPEYGVLIRENEEVYEVIQPFIPTSTDTIESLLSAGIIKKAYRVYDDFEYLNAKSSTPAFFDIDLVYFDQQQSKIVKKTGLNYTVVDL